MPQAKFAPLSSEARKLRSSLGAQLSRHPESDPRVKQARRTFEMQRLVDMLQMLQPFSDDEKDRISRVSGVIFSNGPEELGVEILDSAKEAC